MTFLVVLTAVAVTYLLAFGLVGLALRRRTVAADVADGASDREEASASAAEEKARRQAGLGRLALGFAVRRRLPSPAKAPAATRRSRRNVLAHRES